MTTKTHRTYRIGAPILLVIVGVLLLALPRVAHGQSCTTMSSQPQSCCPTFSDAGTFQLPTSFAANDVKAGVMTTCGGNAFCPLDLVTRADMAVFLENAKHLNQPTVTFPSATGVFADVPASFPLACWIEQFYRDGITAGCGTNPLVYCPDRAVLRQEMAVFIDVAAGFYPPPPCTTPIFNDVPCTSPYAPFINDLYNRGITAGCSTTPPLYCPTSTIKRQEMAVFLFAAFGVQSTCN
jgi:hypothetical protein